MYRTEDTFAAKPLTQLQQTNLPNNIDTRFFDPPRQMAENNFQGSPSKVYPWETYALDAENYANEDYRIAYGPPASTDSLAFGCMACMARECHFRLSRGSYGAQQARYTAIGQHVIPRKHNASSMPYLTGQSFKAHPSERPYSYQHMYSLVAQERGAWIKQMMRDAWQRRQQQEQQQRQQQQEVQQTEYLWWTSEFQSVPMKRSYTHISELPARPRPRADKATRRALPENWAHLEDWIDQQRPEFQIVLDACDSIKHKIDISKVINWVEPEVEVENPWLESSDAGVLNSSMGNMSLI